MGLRGLALAAVFAAAPVVASGCFSASTGGTTTPGNSSKDGPVRKIRFALLAPFDQVANAARAELSATGAVEREASGDTGVRFIVRDDLDAAEDFVQLRPEGTILVLTFRVHRARQSNGPVTNPGAELSRKQNNGVKVENPGNEAVKGGSSRGAQDETDAVKARRNRITRLIVCLPGVGDVVDGDGAPKERQLIDAVDRTTCKRGAQASSLDAGALDAAVALPQPPAVVDAGLADAGARPKTPKTK